MCHNTLTLNTPTLGTEGRKNMTYDSCCGSTGLCHFVISATAEAVAANR